MNRYYALIGTAVAIIAGLNLSGFCYQKLGYLSSGELYQVAILHQADKMAAMPEDPSLRETHAADYVRVHPECCSILRSDPLGSSLFNDLLGFKYFLVRVVYELSKAQIDAAPQDGSFYEAYVGVTPCGRARRVAGMRLQQLPVRSGRS